jgi:hypothetical protein
MATLNEQIDLILNFLRARHPAVSFGEQCARELEQTIRRSLPGERVYIPAPDTGKKREIVEAAKKLPTAVVVERFGVSRQYVHKITRRR